jgi:hypothetical protein
MRLRRAVSMAAAVTLTTVALAAGPAQAVQPPPPPVYDTFVTTYYSTPGGPAIGQTVVGAGWACGLSNWGAQSGPYSNVRPMICLR